MNLSEARFGFKDSDPDEDTLKEKPDRCPELARVFGLEYVRAESSQRWSGLTAVQSHCPEDVGQRALSNRESDCTSKLIMLYGSQNAEGIYMTHTFAVDFEPFFPALLEIPCFLV